MVYIVQFPLLLVHELGLMDCSLYMHLRGAFSVVRFDLPGNAKASMRGTGNRYGLPALFSYMYHSLIFNILIRGVSRKDVLV